MSDQIFDPEDVPVTRMFEGKKVCIALAQYKSTNPRTAFSIMALLDRTKSAVMLNHGDALIAHSRNSLVDNFLKSKMEWILMIDDDMIVPWGGDGTLFNQFTGFNLPKKFSSMNTIDRLLSHQKTLVGGLYFGRQEFKSLPVFSEGAESKTQEEFIRRGPHDLLLGCRWCGTGCLLAHRTVFTDVERVFSHLARNKEGKNGQWFSPSEAELRNATSEAMGILNDEAIDPILRVEKARELLEQGQKLSQRFSGAGTGEDVTLAHRAAMAGHPSHVDLGLVCGHVGEKVFGMKKSV